MDKFIVAALVLMFSGLASASEGMIALASPYSAQQTADRFEKIITSKGLTLFARINHSKNAAGAGMELRATEVIIFGNPKVGTPLMQCSQAMGIDLPQKVLVWQDAANKVWLGYNDPKHLQKRHHIKGCEKVLNKISAVLGKLSAAAVAK